MRKCRVPEYITDARCDCARQHRDYYAFRCPLNRLITRCENQRHEGVRAKKMGCGRGNRVGFGFSAYGMDTSGDASNAHPDATGGGRCFDTGQDPVYEASGRA